jgi:hypothetical protein
MNRVGEIIRSGAASATVGVGVLGAFGVFIAFDFLAPFEAGALAGAGVGFGGGEPATASRLFFG